MSENLAMFVQCTHSTMLCDILSFCLCWRWKNCSSSSSRLWCWWHFAWSLSTPKFFKHRSVHDWHVYNFQEHQNSNIPLGTFLRTNKNGKFFLNNRIKLCRVNKHVFWKSIIVTIIFLPPIKLRFLNLSRKILNIFISQQKCSKWDSVSFFPNKESSKLGPSFPPFILLDKTFTEMVAEQDSK